LISPARTNKYIIYIYAHTFNMQMIESMNLLQQYGWHIVLLLLSISYVNGKFLQPYKSRRKEQQSLQEAMDPSRVSALQKDMMRVREEQQRKVQEASDKAEKERKEKALQRLKDSQVKREKHELRDGQRLGRRDVTSYNPLMSSSSGFTPSYRPARRSRGGGG
jgi:biopolymer transport protein ExbB/TolQ